MKVLKTTDGQHLGRLLPDLNIGDAIDIDGFLFEVQTKTVLSSGHVLLANPNYQLECEE